MKNQNERQLVLIDAVNLSVVRERLGQLPRDSVVIMARQEDQQVKIDLCELLEQVVAVRVTETDEEGVPTKFETQKPEED